MKTNLNIIEEERDQKILERLGRETLRARREYSERLGRIKKALAFTLPSLPKGGL